MDQRRPPSFSPCHDVHLAHWKPNGCAAQQPAASKLARDTSEWARILCRARGNIGERKRHPLGPGSNEREASSGNKRLMVSGEKYQRCSRNKSTQRLPMALATRLSAFGKLRKRKPPGLSQSRTHSSTSTGEWTCSSTSQSVMLRNVPGTKFDDSSEPALNSAPDARARSLDCPARGVDA